MFASLNPSTAGRQRKVLMGSVLAHAAVLLWVLIPSEPLLLNPSWIARGQNGRVTTLYWETQSPDNSDTSSAPGAVQKYRKQRLGHEKLMWKQSTQVAKLTMPAPALTNSEDKAQTQTLSKDGHGAQAGQSYGTLNIGGAYGDEIRPALPIATSDPVVYPWQLPDIAGNEVIEITIDERGEIVGRVVLASLSPEIDTKCLAALENWHFHPATKNGAPIPSKQDAIFPFKARG